MLTSLRLVLSLALLQGAVAADVLTVGPAGEFPQIHAAIAAASDGDVILVADGNYQGFGIDGLSVSVVADTGATVVVEGPSAVVNLAAGQTVLLAGLDWVFPSSTSGVPQVLNLALNEGAVRVERCLIQGALGVVGISSVGVRAFACEDLALVDCVVATDHDDFPSSPFGGSDGVPGLLLIGSRVALQGCAVTGGAGLSGVFVGGGMDGGNGGAGVEASSTTLVLSGCTVTGGAGGPGHDCSIVEIGDGGDGGPGIRGLGGVSLRARESTLGGGAAGAGGFGGFSCDDSQDGQPGMSLDGVTLTTVAGTHRTLMLPVPLREFEPFVGSVSAEPGEFAALLWSPVPDHQTLPGVPGQLLVSLGPPVHLLFLGFVSAGGQLDAPSALPELGPGVEGLRLFLQPLVQDTLGGLHLGAPVTLVALDASL